MLFKNKIIIDNDLFYKNYHNYLDMYYKFYLSQPIKSKDFNKFFFKNINFAIIYNPLIIFYLKENLYTEKFKKINYILSKKIYSIIKYKFNYSYSIMTIETLIETIKFKNISLKILDIKNKLKSPLIESINYLNNNNHEYNFLLFPKYNFTFLKDKNIMSQKDIIFLKNLIQI